MTLFSSEKGFASSTCIKANKLLNTAREYHYNPPAFDEEFSKSVFDKFVELLDPGGRLITKQDLEELKIDKRSVTTLVISRDCSFIDSVAQLYQRKVKGVKEYLNSLPEQQLDFEVSDTLHYHYREHTRYVNEKALRKRWERWLKYQILSAYRSKVDSGKVSPEHFLKEYPSYVDKVVQGELCRIQRRTKRSGESVREFVGDRFLKAMASSLDPHSAYFSMRDKRSFERGLSSEAASFGIQVVRSETGEIKIDGISPGSPAWKSNQLNAGDVVLGLDPKEGEQRDFLCLTLKEAQNILHDPSIKKAVFKVRKKNGKIIRLPLYKKEVDVEENNIESYLLEDGQKIGYIYFPAFYTNMTEDPKLGNGCANDVSKAILRLKQENVDGLIFDVRGNGGGAVLEALQLAGIFIDRGDLCIIDRSTNEPVAVQDPNRGTLFKEPLVILTNYFSASASELFASALQDQNRAVVAGTHTYGKATSQQVLPLDLKERESSDRNRPAEEGYLKTTVGKIYRVQGGSYQNQGVIPDIQLPHLYSELKVGERYQPHALKGNSTDKEAYYYPLDSLPIDELRAKSKKRVAKDSGFARIKANRPTTKSSQLFYSIPLQPEGYFDYFRSSLKKQEKEEELEGAYEVKSMDPLAEMGMLTAEEKEILDLAMTSIQEDAYIKEAYYILNDLLNLKSN